MRIQKTKLFKFLAVVLISIFIIAALKNHTSIIRSSSLDFTSFILKSIKAISSFPKRILPFASLREENRILKSKLDYLSRKMIEMEAISIENQKLKDLLNFKKALPYTTIPAQVIGRDPSNWSNSLILDRGTIHGIRENRAVLSPKGLVGRIIELGKYSSKALLITDQNSKVGVIVERNRQGGILIGRPDGKCRMIYIALDSDITAGDKVMTAGLSNIYPKDVLVGEVLKVDREPGRLYKYAVVRPAQDMSKLEEVLCVK